MKVKNNQINNNLAMKKIFITGASGFIGKHLCKHLNDCYHIEPKVLVHSLPMEKNIKCNQFYGDILSLDLLIEATKNIDVIIHCANTYDHIINWDISVRGTKNICEAARINKVGKLIFLSSVAVYGYNLPPIVDEKTPYKKVLGDIYNNSKIKAEKIVFSYFKNYKLPVVVLQPSIVYGPDSLPWVIKPLLNIKEKNTFFINNEKGTANPVYIDDVIKAIILSISNIKAVGQKFIISGGYSITWSDFFCPLFLMMNQKPPPLNVQQNSTINNFLLTIYKLGRKTIKKLPCKWIVPTKLKSYFKKRVNFIDQHQDFIENDLQKKIYQYDCVFDITKASKILSYKPEISFGQGMQKTKKWFKNNKSDILNYEVY